MAALLPSPDQQAALSRLLTDRLSVDVSQGVKAAALRASGPLIAACKEAESVSPQLLQLYISCTQVGQAVAGWQAGRWGRQ